MRKQDLPDKKKNSAGALAQSQNLTLPNLQYVLKEMGVGVRFNVMSNTTVYEKDGVGTDFLSQDVMRLTVQDMLLGLDISNLSRFDEMIQSLARRAAFHPMAEWLAALPQDDVDHIGILADSVVTDNALWPVYLEKWLVQCVEGVCGWGDRAAKLSLPHVLVLVGGQGIGKSYWLKKLGGPWLKGEAELHLSSASGKDHQLAALKFPLVELSELDGIFRKSDVSHMKAFISREEDEIRAPYERKALVRPRMTSFCASVNDAEFLNDSSGSRRFWPVLVDGIDWEAPVDMSGVWAQAYEMWADGVSFQLTAAEDSERAAVALDVHTQTTPAQETVQEYLRLHIGNARFPEAAMNRTEIMNMLFGERNHWHRDVSIVGKTVIDILGKHQTIDGKQRSWMVPYNQFAADRASWPDKISLKSV